MGKTPYKELRGLPCKDVSEIPCKEIVEFPGNGVFAFTSMCMNRKNWADIDIYISSYNEHLKLYLLFPFI